jgi:LmbE family N-acetylglucosaminyl deacetylase
MPDKSVYALAFSPHMHDSEGGVGGTIARWTREGKEVVIVAVTDGSCGSSNPKLKPAELTKRREAEQLAAAKVLGVKEVVFLRQPDLRLADTYEMRQEICRLILTYRPQIVCTHDPHTTKYMNNPDHRILARMVMEVSWPMAIAPNVFPELLKQGLQPHHVKEVWYWNAENPNYRVDVTDTFDVKWEAWKCHRSQIEDWLLHVNPPKTYEEAEQGNLNFIKSFDLKAAEATEFGLAEAFMRVILPPGL